MSRVLFEDIFQYGFSGIRVSGGCFQGRKFIDKRKGHGFIHTMQNCLQPLFLKKG